MQITAEKLKEYYANINSVRDIFFDVYDVTYNHKYLFKGKNGLHVTIKDNFYEINRMSRYLLFRGSHYERLKRLEFLRQCIDRHNKLCIKSIGYVRVSLKESNILELLIRGFMFPKTYIEALERRTYVKRNDEGYLVVI